MGLGTVPRAVLALGKRVQLHGRTLVESLDCHLVISPWIATWLTQTRYVAHLL